MTLTELLAAVRRQTVESTDSVSDSDVTNMLNEGYRYVAVAERWPWLLTSASFDVVADTREYDMSSDLSISDFMWIHSVHKNGTDDGALDEISYSQYVNLYGGDPMVGSSAYSFYILGDDTLGLVPVPSESATDAYTLTYYKTPTVLSGGSATPEWTSTLHHILIDYGVSQIWEREEYFTERDISFQKFLLGLNELKRFYKMRSKDNKIIVGDGAGGNRNMRRADLTYNLPFG